MDIDKIMPPMPKDKGYYINAIPVIQGLILNCLDINCAMIKTLMSSMVLNPPDPPSNL